MAERELLLDLAASFNEYGGDGSPSAGQGEGRPGDAYNARTSWEEVLAPFGWQKVLERDGVAYWRRPGKGGQVWSATTGRCKSRQGEDRLYVFSTSCPPFEAEQSYSKFAAYCLLNHGGDFRAAARALGGETRQPAPANGLPRGDAYEGPDPAPAPLNGHADGIDLVIPPDSCRWPEPPAREAFHGLAGHVVGLIAPQTEASAVAILVQVLVMFGSAIGRNAHWTVEEDQHYGNLFTVLVGETGRGRKGVSKGRALKVFHGLADGWVEERVKSGLSSGEGLIGAVRDAEYTLHNVKSKGRVVDQQRVKQDEGVQDKRLLVIETEFARPLRVMRREGNTLSAILRDAWENGSLSSLTRKGLKASGAHVSLIGHITREELKKELGNVELVNGLANRILWVLTRRSRSLPLGGQPVDLRQAGGLMADAVERAKRIGRVGLSPAAEQLWREQIFPELDREQPGAIGLVLGRGDAQCRRLAMLYALLDMTDTVGVPHLRAGHAVWQYCERSARAIFGLSSGDRLADRVLGILTSQRPAWVWQTEIHRCLGNRTSADELGLALGVLEAAGLIVGEKVRTGRAGPPVRRWRVAEVMN